ncbi:hypothetical protein PHLCEN_2v1399 [Hermanssonia centrifuga]|uniref:FAD-binding PCMH-type domain-containing protein n=1 Tax=Hermanssonia centrifuga TaxID=98765 RepID=A0A2R6S3B8_9APHY|nr:hypothetical protein PHLCEN_2v1399 [Hermanssonia centrifuga]
MKNITFHNTFTPDGAPKPVVYNQVISLGAGVQWHEAYDAVHAHGRVIVGGLTPGASVGAAGGWLQGGGHSALSPKYGLGVDNAIEITVVTSSGAYLITNQFQNPDLFWALRGGGGGTYGIVTSVTYQTHPSTPLIAAFFSTHVNTTVNNASASTPSPVLNQLFTEFVRVTPALSDGGWAGYATIVPGPPTNAPSLRFFYIAPDISWEVANATLNLFFAFAQNLSAHSSVENGGALSIDVATSFPVDSFYSLYELIFTNETGQVGAPVEIASRLLPRKLIEDDYHKVADTILSLPFPDFFLLGGGAVSKVKPSSAGLNPAWREALIHTVVASTWQEGASADEINGALNNLKQYVTTLHDLAPSSGAYFNEASLYEINPQYTFFGDHYHKLEAIKAKYDPIDLFVVAEGVGSNKWDRSLTCRT